MKCYRCEGVTRVAWGNTIANGGRMGPCPVCGLGVWPFVQKINPFDLAKFKPERRPE